MFGKKFFLLISLLLLAYIPMHARPMKLGKQEAASKLVNKIKGERKRIKDRHSKDKCADTHKICELPVTIDKPGKWFVCKDLSFDGDVAITITANNVTLDLLNHDLIVGNNTTAILAQDVRELIIKNDKISTPAVSDALESRGIFLVNCEKVRIENVFIENVRRGIEINENTINVHVTESHFKNNTGGLTANGSAIRSRGSSSVLLVEKSTFEGSAGTVDLASSQIDIENAAHVNNCFFNDVDLAILFSQGSGLLFENNIIVGSATNTFSLIGIGASNVTEPVTNASIRNCTLKSTRPNAEAFDAIAITPADGVLIENVMIDAQARGVDFFPIVGGIHLGLNDTAQTANNVTIKNVVIVNTNDNGIVSESSRGLFIDNANISEALIAGVHFIDTNASTIKNSLIDSNAGDGVLLEGTSSANSVLSNTISSNDGYGVHLTSGTSLNAVQNNVVTNNAILPQIFDEGTGNVTTPNTVIP